MEPERKQKIEYKKGLDKKHRPLFIDDDKVVKNQQKKQFKKKKQDIIEQDSWEELEDYL